MKLSLAALATFATLIGCGTEHEPGATCALNESTRNGCVCAPETSDYGDQGCVADEAHARDEACCECLNTTATEPGGLRCLSILDTVDSCVTTLDEWHPVFINRDAALHETCLESSKCGDACSFLTGVRTEGVR